MNKWIVGALLHAVSEHLSNSIGLSMFLVFSSNLWTIFHADYDQLPISQPRKDVAVGRGDG